MAEADDTSSTIDWIWLRDALGLAAALLGSVALAKEQLREWLAAGKLPWSCTRWEGLDAEGLAEKKRQKLDAEGRAEKSREQGNGIGGIIYSLPSAAYCSGDPRFWSATLWIDWEANDADERRRHGARAFGVRVSRAHLRALLPGVPDGNEKVGTQTRRVLKVLKKLYPPDGKVSDDVSTEVVRAQVSKELSADNKNQELAAPSWDTVKRALGRG